MSPQYFLRDDGDGIEMWWSKNGSTADASLAMPFKSKFAAEQFARENFVKGHTWQAVKENTETWS